MQELTVKGAQILSLAPTQDDPFEGDVFIQGNQIAEVGPNLPERGRVLRARGLLLMPGFVQSHIHLCQTLFRNTAEDLELLDWLHQKIWPLEAAHNENSLRASVQLGVAELLLGGTTAILDMGTVYLTDVLFEEVARLGLRANIGKTFMDSGEGIPDGLWEEGRASLEDALRLHQTWEGRANGRLKVNLAPRFALSCSEEILREVGRVSAEQKMIVHTHTSENPKELEAVLRQTGQRNLAYYHALGLNRYQLSAAHGIWLDEQEMDILASTNTHILHCPSSNLKLGSGIARVPEMLARNIQVSLGADGAPCNNNLDVFTEMRLAGLIQKPRAGVASLSAREIVKMATVGGARAAGWGDQLGTIEKGKLADLILVDLKTPHSVPVTDVYTALVYAARPSDVRTVLVDGQILVENGRLTTLDAEAVVRRAEEEFEKLLKRAKI